MLERLKQLDRGWWLALCIFSLGLWLQLSGYNMGLVITDTDEGRNYADMLYRLEGGAALEKQTLAGYPPLIFWIHEAAHRLTADPSESLLKPHIVRTITVLKLWAVGINMLTALFLILAGRLLSGWKVGLSAALIWLVLPTVISRTVLGLTEAWQVCAVTGSAYFMLQALAHQDRWAAVISTALALIAFLFKYSIFPVFGLGLVATLWCGRQSPRHWAWPLLIQGILIAVGAAFILSGLKTEGLTTQVETSRFLEGNIFESLTNWSRLASIWRAAAGELRLRPYDYSLPLAVCLAIAAIALSRTTWKRLGLFLILGFVSLHLILISAYLVYPEGVQRYTTPPSALWVLVIVTSVGWVLHAMAVKGWQKAAHWIFAIGLVVWVAPALAKSMTFMIINMQPYTKEAYAHWTEATLPNDGALLIAYSDWWLFDQTYYEYHASRVSYQGKITDFSRQQWLDKGILYATLTQTDLQNLSQTEEGQRDLAVMKRLKMFAPSGWMGEAMYVYTLPIYQSPVEGVVTFDNGLTLHGCRLKDESHDGQKRLSVQCLWQSAQAQTQPWKLYLHLVPSDSRVPLAQADGPLTLPTRPPNTWTDAEEILIGPPYIIDIPQDVEMSSLRLLVGIYDESTGLRALQNGSDYVELPLASVLQTPK